MRFLNLAFKSFVVFAFLVSGCQKLGNTVLVDETVQVPSQENKAKIIDGPKKNQKVTVQARAEEGSFSVYITLEKDREAVMDGLANMESPGNKALAKKEKTKDAVIETTVPAGQDFAVILSNSGPNDVAVKLKVANAP